MSGLTRRQFVMSVGSAALLAGCGRLPWQAPQTVRVPRVGFLSPSFPIPDHESLWQGLHELGYVEGQNIIIERKYAEGAFDRLPGLASELVRLDLDVIVVVTTPAIHAARDATGTTPIIMVASQDPVGTGLVAALNRPAGNVTGLSSISPALSGKRLELLREVAPQVSRVAVLSNPANPAVVLDWTATQAAAQVLRVELHLVEARGPDDFEAAFGAITAGHSDGLIVFQDGLFTSNAKRIVDLTARTELPAIYAWSTFAHAGGLMVYGPNLSSQFRRAAYYVDRILKGAKPADLPVEQPMRFDFVVNMRTARELGIVIPHEVALQITEVIE